MERNVIVIVSGTITSTLARGSRLLDLIDLLGLLGLLGLFGLNICACLYVLLHSSVVGTIWLLFVNL